ncbi:jg14317 [Pararge aegeria aegeria]|uniref:Jg14317 protein n=1 Tax=Pararge aegeria aegeria TaxID=348720 RepID=A0A8S4R4S7_9NEOP|nr:jg14317 [Pararge aegeria aegeria]
MSICGGLIDYSTNAFVSRVPNKNRPLRQGQTVDVSPASTVAFILAALVRPISRHAHLSSLVIGHRQNDNLSAAKNALFDVKVWPCL